MNLQACFEDNFKPSTFRDFLSMEGIVVVDDFGSLEILSTLESTRTCELLSPYKVPGLGLKSQIGDRLIKVPNSG